MAGDDDDDDQHDEHAKTPCYVVAGIFCPMENWASSMHNHFRPVYLAVSSLQSENKAQPLELRGRETSQGGKYKRCRLVGDGEQQWASCSETCVCNTN